jgi:hypothetical protein
MKPGFRQAVQPSTKDKFRGLQTELANSQMAMNITQAMVRQLMQSTKAMGDDLGRALNLLNELQYKVLALQSVSNVDVAQLNAKIADLRLKDFNEASDNEDARDGFTVGEEVKDDSVVILTSTAKNANNEEVGIFRSRIKLSDTGLPELISGLLGKKVGEKVDVKLNGDLHTIELLGIRQPKTVEQTEQVAEGNASPANA